MRAWATGLGTLAPVVSAHLTHARPVQGEHAFIHSSLSAGGYSILGCPNEFFVYNSNRGIGRFGTSFSHMRQNIFNSRSSIRLEYGRRNHVDINNRHEEK